MTANEWGVSYQDDEKVFLIDFRARKGEEE